LQELFGVELFIFLRRGLSTLKVRVPNLLCDSQGLLPRAIYPVSVSFHKLFDAISSSVLLEFDFLGNPFLYVDYF